MNLKDKAFLERFLAEKSSILNGSENLWGHNFFHYTWVGVVLTHQSKVTKSPPIRVSSTKFLYYPHKALLTHTPTPTTPPPPYVTWDIILIKTRIKKRSLKFSATKRSHFFIESWTFSACHNFTRSYNSWTSKSAAYRKLLVLFLTKILEIPHAIGRRRGGVKPPIPTDQVPMEKSVLRTRLLL